MRAATGTWAPTTARTIPGYFNAVPPTVPAPVLGALLAALAREAAAAGADALARCPLPAGEDDRGRAIAPGREDADLVLAAVERSVAAGARDADRRRYAGALDRAEALRHTLWRQCHDVRTRCGCFSRDPGVLHRELDRRLARGEPGAGGDLVAVAAQYAARALCHAARGLWFVPPLADVDAYPDPLQRLARSAGSAALALEGLWHLQGEREVRYDARGHARRAAEQRVLGLVRAALRRPAGGPA